MGYYIETPTNHNKAQFICTEHGGTIVENPEWDNLCPDEALIVVVDNGPFEAAGFAYNEAEFNEFTSPAETRPRTYVVMDREKAEELSGYAAAMKKREKRA